jgi:ABC-2 type transport system permease protein
VTDERLWFLLRHEFRLWHRGPQGLPAQWPLYAFMAGTMLLSALFMWALNRFQFVSFSANSPPDGALWIAGSFVNASLFFGLIGTFLVRQRATVEQQMRNWLHSTPLPSRISFASAVLHPILTSAVSGNIFLLIYSIPLAVIFLSPRLFAGIHLTATALVMVSVSLGFWGLHASVRWGDSILWKMLQKACYFSLVGLYLCIFGLPLGLGGRFLPSERVIEIVMEQAKRGNILGGDSWLWFPARAVFLDPLPSIIWMTVGVCMTWLTIQFLHRPLSFDLQSTLSPQKLVTSKINTPQQFQGNLLYLLVLRDWKRLMSGPGFLSVILMLASYVALFYLPGKTLVDNAVNLAISGVIVPALASSLLTHSGFADDPMKDLLRASPISISKAKTYKLLAALIPVWIALLPFVITVGILGKPWASIAALGFAATTSHAFLRAWNACPIKSTVISDIFSFSDLDAGCRDRTLSRIEGLSSFLWFIIPMLLLAGQIPGGLFFLLFEGFILFCAYRRNQKLGDSWSVG